MRAFATILSLVSLLATSVVADTAAGSTTTPCLSDADASTVANRFRNLTTAYSKANADAWLTSDFTDYSDSVIELMNSGCPNSPIKLGSPTFTSRAEYEAGQGSQPSIPFQILNVWHDCDTVIMRWKSAMTPGQVTGIIVLETVYQKKQYLIKTVYSEFNSGSWLVNLGIFKPSNCTTKREVEF